MGRWLASLKTDPTGWLLDNACPPIRYRVLTEILGRPDDDPEVSRAREANYNYKPATRIAGQQQDSGVWHNALLAFEPPNSSRNRGPGMMSQVLALLEFGWKKDHPIIWRAADLLLRYVHLDPTADLFELRGICATNAAIEKHLRHMLARMSAAILCRAGYSADDRVKQRVEEILRDLDRLYTGDALSNLYTERTVTVPREEDGDRTLRILRDDAVVPDYPLLTLLAFSEGAADGALRRSVLGKVGAYMAAPQPAAFAAFDLGGKIIPKATDLLVRDQPKDYFVREKRLGQLLQDLELLARTGLLERRPEWVSLLQWVVGMQDGEGVFRADDVMDKGVSRLAYHYFPLEDSWRGRSKKYTDVAFRVLLILTILDRAGV